MAYKVYVEVIPRPDNVEDWKWNQIEERSGTPQNGHAVWKSHTGGYAWKVTGSSYNNEDDADTKKEQLEASDSSNRRYKVLEV